MWSSILETFNPYEDILGDSEIIEAEFVEVPEQASSHVSVGRKWVPWVAGYLLGFLSAYLFIGFFF